MCFVVTPVCFLITELPRQLFAILLATCILTTPVISAPTSLQVFRSTLNHHDNHANSDDTDDSTSLDPKALWRKSLLDDVAPANLRWRSPCAGSRPVDGIDTDGGIFEDVETAALVPHEHYLIISRKAGEQHSRVYTLMGDYVSLVNFSFLLQSNLDIKTTYGQKWSL